MGQDFHKVINLRSVRFRIFRDGVSYIGVLGCIGQHIYKGISEDSSSGGEKDEVEIL